MVKLVKFSPDKKYQLYGNGEGGGESYGGTLVLL